MRHLRIRSRKIETNMMFERLEAFIPKNKLCMQQEGLIHTEGVEKPMMKIGDNLK